MDKMAFDRGNPQEEPPRRVAKKSKKRFLWLTLVALLAMIAVVLSILYDRGEFDGLRRRVLYAKAQKDENGCAQLYRYASDQSGSFASLEGSLATVSMHQISVLDEAGKSVYEQAVKFQTPTLVRSADRAAAYDVGGKTIYVLSAKGLVCQVDTTGEILSVALNASGYLTVTSNESGCKAAVRVYDASGQPVFAYRSADRFIMTAALSADSRTLAAVTMGQSSGVFTSYVVFYRINSEAALTTSALTGSLIYDLFPMGDRFCAVMEEQLCFWIMTARSVPRTATAATTCAVWTAAATAMPCCCWAATATARSTVSLRWAATAARWPHWMWTARY